ncbi:mitochondrial carrier domain-containing protein [Cladochytrium replicatum]|nr:mitochondrial carrier domain-containing protein [Cladochytrium replicatum]
MPKQDSSMLHPPTPDPHPDNPLRVEDAKTRRARIRSLFDQIRGENEYLDAGNIVRRFAELKRTVGSGSHAPAGSSKAVDGKGETLAPSLSGLVSGPRGSAEMYAKELVSIADQSKNGRVDFAEFERFVTNKERELWNLFQQIDTSNDNAIQRSELKASLQAAGIDVSSDDIDAFMATVDQDRDGVLEFSEWRDFLLLLPHKPTLRSVFMFYRQVFDVDINSDAMPIPSDLNNSVPTQIKYFACGGIAGAFSRTVTAPLDRIRVLLQTASTKGSTGSSATNIPARRGIIDTAKTIYANGGFASFFRGNGINILKIIPESSIKFLVFETSKSYLAKAMGKESDSIGMAARFAAGGMAGLVSQFSVYPIETTKTRLMSQIVGQAAPGVAPVQPGRSLLAQTISSMRAEGGFKAAYRGAPIALLGVIPFAGIDLMVFETLKVTYLTFKKNAEDASPPPAGSPKSGNHKNKGGDMLVLLGCGMVSSSVASTLMYPISVVRTRLQAQGTPAHPQRYSSTYDAARKLYQEKAFYRGLAPTLLKVVPAVSISYVVYESSKQALGLP